MKYPLQKELEKDLKESAELLADTHVCLSSDKEKELATKYYNAIKRINDICVNRNRF